MEAGALLIAIGAFLLAGVGYLVFQVVADIAADEAKEAVFRRASFAVRRSRHRALMKTGYVCARCWRSWPLSSGSRRRRADVKPTQEMHAYSP